MSAPTDQRSLSNDDSRQLAERLPPRVRGQYFPEDDGRRDGKGQAQPARDGDSASEPHRPLYVERKKYELREPDKPNHDQDVDKPARDSVKKRGRRDKATGAECIPSCR